MKKVIVMLLLFIGTMTVNAANVDIITGNVYTNSTQARYLQKELSLVAGCGLVTDGGIGALTTNCIKIFQRANGLTDNGYVNSATISKLNTQYKLPKLIVSSNTLNIRNGAGTNYTILKTVTKGAMLVVKGSTTVNGVKWYKVISGNVVGYVISTYVKTTFVEVDITSQTLRLYKNTELILDTPVTTGKKDGTHDTNKGYFSVILKQTERHLQPSNAYVRYWIRFYNPRALGIHDADWRGMDVNFSWFGGNRYTKSGSAGSKYSGSHGCVNIPVPKMPMIYNNISVGTPVFVH